MIPNTTIIKFDPRWGHTTTCFDSQNQSKATGRAVYQNWRENRVLTKKDIGEITVRANGVQPLLEKYAKKVGALRAHWHEIHGDVAALPEDCSSSLFQLDANCIIEQIGEMRGEFDEAASMAHGVTQARIAAFRECDFLMVNAPNPQTAQSICQQKLVCFENQQEAFNKIGEYQRDIAKVQSDAFKARDDLMATITALFQALLSAIMALVSIIQKGFEALVAAAGVALKALGWFAKHPSAILVIGGVVGLGVLAFVARPYVSIAKAALGIGKRRNPRCLSYSRGY